MNVAARLRRRLFSTRRFIVVRKMLQRAPVADHLGEVRFRRAGSADLDRLHTLDAYGRGSAQRAYVDLRNDLLFVACHHDRIVATRRCSLEIRDPLVTPALTLRPGQIWVADIFCLPEYRSHGVAAHLILFADGDLAAQQYSEVLAAVDASNIPSLRASLRAGYELAYEVSSFRVLRYERVHIDRQISKRLSARLK